MTNVFIDNVPLQPKITELYAYVTYDEKGNEGIVSRSFDTPFNKTMMMPFVCSSKETMESLRSYVLEILKETGKSIRLIRLTNREVLEEFTNAN